MGSQRGPVGPRQALQAQAPVPVPRIANALFIGSVVVALLVILVAAITMWQARQDAERLAERSAENLLRSIVGYTEQRIALYAFALDQFVGRLANSEIAALSPSTQAYVLTGIAEHFEYVDNALILDADGNIILASHPERPVSGNFVDRDYFRVQRDNPDAGVYISEPFESRLGNNDLSIGLSRRLSNRDGSFAGVVVLVARLAMIEDFFSTLDVGRNGSLSLLSTCGDVLVRNPLPHGPGGVGSNIAQTGEFRWTVDQDAGSFIERSATDGIERHYTFARVPNEPLIVNVGLATEDIFADWRRRVLVTGALSFVACLIIVLLATILRRELHRRAEVEAVLARQSQTDGLTGLDNRRRYDLLLEHEWQRASRNGMPLSLLMIDIDRFKLVNDTYGHARGDEVLKQLARIIDSCLRRAGDHGARYGGEEFAVLLPETDDAGGKSVAEAIRRTCEQHEGDLPKFTVSIGVTSIRPGRGTSWKPFQEAADRALYRAKAEGRNRIVLAD